MTNDQTEIVKGGEKEEMDLFENSDVDQENLRKVGIRRASVFVEVLRLHLDELRDCFEDNEIDLK